MNYLFTSESVTEGHPDKLCDLISDSILDAYLEKDPTSRVACEVVAGKDLVFITGEITSKGKVDIEKVARNAIKSVGYFGDVDINYKSCNIIINVTTQSPDIAMGTNDTVGGAGDQGMMFGYACDETKEYMPLGISLAHQLSRRLTEVRREGIIKGIGADGKTQVTVEYENNQVKRIHTILVSVQHKDNKDLEFSYLCDSEYTFVSKDQLDLKVQNIFNKNVIIQTLPSVSRNVFEQLKKDNIISFDKELEVVSHRLVTELVKSRLGIGFVVKNYVLKDLLNGELYEVDILDVLPKRRIEYTLKKNFTPSYAVKSFLEIMKR